MRFAFYRNTLIALTSLALSPALNAWEDPRVSLRGFGTLGAVWNSADEANFRRDVIQPDGSRGDIDWRTDTRLGLQASFYAGTTWSATAQVLSRYDADGSFAPDLTWGFVKYAPSESLTFRAGRLGWDVYLLADSREVGYSYPWVRPPTEFFGSLQLYSYEGLDASLKLPAGEGILEVKLSGGEAGDESTSLSERLQIDVDISTLAGISFSYQADTWQARIGHTFVDLSLGLKGDITLPGNGDEPPTRVSLDYFPAPAVDLGFSTAGIMGRQGPWNWQLMYAYTDSSNDEQIPSFESAYISVGYRLGEWMPYASYATTSTQGENPTSRVPNELADLLEGTAGGSLPGQHTLSLGTRYDFRDNMALKLQIDRVHARNHLLWTPTQVNWDGRATVISATLDFIF